MEWMKDEFTLTDDLSRLDLERTFMLLHGTYWGIRRPREVVAKMITRNVEQNQCYLEGSDSDGS